jgi:hypothetical protein
MLVVGVVLSVFAIQVLAAPGGAQYGPPPRSTDEFSIQNYQKKLGWFTQFADAFMYPNNVIQADMINSTLLAENIQGRVDMTTTFDGRELNTEVTINSHD